MIISPLSSTNSGTLILLNEVYLCHNHVGPGPKRGPKIKPELYMDDTKVKHDS